MQAPDYKRLLQLLVDDAELLQQMQTGFEKSLEHYPMQWVFEWFFFPYQELTGHAENPSQEMISLIGHTQLYRGHNFEQNKKYFTEGELELFTGTAEDVCYFSHAANLRSLVWQLQTLDSEDYQEVEHTRQVLIARLERQANSCIYNWEFQEDLGDSDACLMMFADSFIRNFDLQKQVLNDDRIRSAKELVQNASGKLLPTQLAFLVFDPALIHRCLGDNSDTSSAYVGIAYRWCNTVAINPRNLHKRLAKSPDLIVHELLHILQEDSLQKEDAVDWMLVEGSTESMTLKLTERPRTLSKYSPLLHMFKRVLDRCPDEQSRTALHEQLAFNGGDSVKLISRYWYGEQAQDKEAETVAVLNSILVWGRKNLYINKAIRSGFDRGLKTL